jgi:signal transduction histidine kinase/ActR/RegA family two-component response regulator
MQIRRKLLVIAMTVVAFALTLTGAVFTVVETVSFKRSVTDDAGALAEIVALNCRAILSFKEPAAATQLLASLSAHRRIAGAAVYAADGELFAEYRRAGGGAVVPATLPPDDHIGQRGYLVLVRPVELDGRRIGTVYFSCSMQEVYARFLLYFAVVLVVLSGSLLLSIPLCNFLMRRISGPILSLADTAAAVTRDNNYAVRAVKSGNDELGLLTDAFNRMLTAIAEREVSLQRTSEQLRQSEKMQAIGQLAGGVAHDFNNQLSGIMGFAEMLAERLEDPELKKYADQILTASTRAADLTRQLLAFGRKGKYLNVPTDIHKVIGEVVDLLNRSIDKRIEIKRCLEANPSVVVADPTQLQNAILNLALNARDAMPQGGMLSFVTSVVFLEAQPDEELKPGRYVQISVTDTGVGMDAATKKRLFEPFFTTKEVGKGTGLGLASAYGTIKNHGGTIRVYSELGHGSTFRVYLPVLEEGAGPVVPEVAVSAPSGHGRVLLVDDEPVILEVGAAMLRRQGYEVVTCSDPREAVALYGRDWRSIDLVILDMVMPKMGGRDVFLAMREINPAVKALLASGFSINGEAQGIMNLGVMAFVSKPFRLADLAQGVARGLGSAVGVDRRRGFGLASGEAKR